MRPLSKSRLLAYRQCPKRLWLEVYRPECREDSAATQACFSVGIASVNSQDVSMTPKIMVH